MSGEDRFEIGDRVDARIARSSCVNGEVVEVRRLPNRVLYRIEGGWFNYDGTEPALDCDVWCDSYHMKIHEKSDQCRKRRESGKGTMIDPTPTDIAAAAISALINPKTPQDYEAKIVFKNGGVEYHHGGHVAMIADEPETESQRKVLAEAKEVFASVFASSLRFSDEMMADALKGEP